jgi:hypothetical protein
LDLDAEALAVVDCGGKSGIDLLVRVCRALEIPFVILHDEDIWPVDHITDLERRKKQEAENRAAEDANVRIRAATGGDARLFVMSPSLEQVLGISRDARDKPRRIAEALQRVDVRNPPAELRPLIDAVEAIKQ